MDTYDNPEDWPERKHPWMGGLEMIWFLDNEGLLKFFEGARKLSCQHPYSNHEN